MHSSAFAGEVLCKCSLDAYDYQGYSYGLSANDGKNKASERARESSRFSYSKEPFGTVLAEDLYGLESSLGNLLPVPESFTIEGRRGKISMRKNFRIDPANQSFSLFYLGTF